MENMDQKDLWVVAMESSLEGETIPDEFPDDLHESHDGLIHTVPKSLLYKNTRMFYLPQVISLGPYHFRKKWNPHDQIGLLKSDVSRKVHHEILGGLNSRKRLESGLKSVVESFKNKEKKIKKSYAKKFEDTDEVCAWMIAVDACFVVQILERFRTDDHAGESVSASFDHILSRKQHHPLLTEIVKDMLKMENQLPFWALQEIRPDIEDWFESALKNLSPIEVADRGSIQVYKKYSHILQFLHDYIVDRRHITLPDPQRTPSGSDLICFYGNIFITAFVCFVVNLIVIIHFFSGNG